MPELLSPTFIPTQADLNAHKVVKQQFGEVSVHFGFFDDFYKDFTGQSPEIAAAFAKTDMKAQKIALRKGLAFLIMFAEGDGFAIKTLDKLGQSHSRSQLNISPKLYPLWQEALIRTVRKHALRFDAASELAWRHILQLGVDRIKSAY